MVVFVARRILYSIPVVAVSTFLSFTFVSLAGNPTLALKRTRASRSTRSTCSPRATT
jgi:hypothetical protein